MFVGIKALPLNEQPFNSNPVPLNLRTHNLMRTPLQLVRRRRLEAAIAVAAFAEEEVMDFVTVAQDLAQQPVAVFRGENKLSPQKECAINVPCYRRDIAGLQHRRQILRQKLATSHVRVERNVLGLAVEGVDADVHFGVIGDCW